MPKKTSGKEIAVKDLRWTLDLKKLSFKTTDELKPLSEIIGQQRGVEAFRFGAGIKKAGYNIFVTGPAGSGRLATVKKLLQEISADIGNVPDDLCYVNNFKKPDAPVLLKFKAGQGIKFKKDVHDLIDTLNQGGPQVI